MRFPLNGAVDSLYLKHFHLELSSTSNRFLGPLSISIASSQSFSLYLECSYLELLSVLNKNFDSMYIFLLSLSQNFFISQQQGCCFHVNEERRTKMSSVKRKLTSNDRDDKQRGL